MGELFQNNHHRYAMSPSFAARRWEIDPTYVIMKVLHASRVIDLTGAQKMRWTPADLAAAPKPRSATLAIARVVVPERRSTPRNSQGRAGSGKITGGWP